MLIANPVASSEFIVNKIQYQFELHILRIPLHSPKDFFSLRNQMKHLSAKSNCSWVHHFSMLK